jgi:beta-phosphoglucomutase-like phosphatase (HAD superfamily)
MTARLPMFDVEGTFVDCVREILVCWRSAFRQFGYEFSLSVLHPHSGRDPDDMIKALLSRRDAERFGAVLKKEQGKRYREECLPYVRVCPGVRLLFEATRQAGLAARAPTGRCSQEHSQAGVSKRHKFCSRSREFSRNVDI